MVFRVSSSQPVSAEEQAAAPLEELVLTEEQAAAQLEEERKAHAAVMAMLTPPASAASTPAKTPLKTAPHINAAELEKLKATVTALRAHQREEANRTQVGPVVSVNPRV
eukprot:7150575-Pyramimonas_sp.AAC.1